MFIAHGDKIRRHSRWILGAVLVVLVPSFVLLFTQGGGRDRQAGELPTIRGAKVPRGEFEAARRAVRDLYVISRNQRWPGTAEMDDVLKRDAMVRLIMLRKARELGLSAPPELVAEQIRQLPMFRTENGQFHPELYQRYLIYLNNHGITGPRFEQLMREQMLISQLEDAVGAAAKVTPLEVEHAYAPFHERVSIEFVRFEVGDQPPPAVTDEDVAQFFEANKELFRRPAQVKVRFARFSFEVAAKKAVVSDDEIKEYFERYATIYTNGLEAARAEIREELARIAGRRLAGEAAEHFSVQLVPEAGQPKPEFAKLAAAAGAEVGETGFVSLGDTVPGVPGARAFLQAAFALSYNPDPPFSDAVLAEDGYYVMEYLDGKPSRLPELTEVRDEVKQRVVTRRTHEATAQRGRDAREQVRQLMGAGKTFGAACAELKLKVEPRGPVTVVDREADIPAATRVLEATIGMATNTVSDFIPTATGGLFFQLTDRQPFDRELFEKQRSVLARELLRRNRQALIQGWLNAVWQEEQVNLGTLRRRSSEAGPAGEAEEDYQPQPRPAPAS